MKHFLGTLLSTNNRPRSSSNTSKRKPVDLGHDTWIPGEYKSTSQSRAPRLDQDISGFMDEQDVESLLDSAKCYLSSRYSLKLTDDNNWSESEIFYMDSTCPEGIVFGPASSLQNVSQSLLVDKDKSVIFRLPSYLKGNSSLPDHADLFTSKDTQLPRDYEKYTLTPDQAMIALARNIPYDKNLAKHTAYLHYLRAFLASGTSKASLDQIEGEWLPEFHTLALASSSLLAKFGTASRAQALEDSFCRKEINWRPSNTLLARFLLPIMEPDQGADIIHSDAETEAQSVEANFFKF